MSGRGYPLPRELARHVPKRVFGPDELRRACREAGEGLGHADAREARFRSAAEMVEMWRGLDLPAHVAPYALRDARLGYLTGYAGMLTSGEMPEGSSTRLGEQESPHQPIEAPHVVLYGQNLDLREARLGRVATQRRGPHHGARTR